MRLLARNKQTVYYQNYKSTGEATVTSGSETLYTGEKTIVYDTVKSVKCYVKSAIGMNEAEPFGDFTTKRRTLYLDKNQADINELSLLWVGIDPKPDLQGMPTVPHNFTVDGVSIGLNHIRVAIRRVEVKLNASVSS